MQRRTRRDRAANGDRHEGEAPAVPIAALDGAAPRDDEGHGLGVKLHVGPAGRVDAYLELAGKPPDLTDVGTRAHEKPLDQGRRREEECGETVRLRLLGAVARAFKRGVAEQVVCELVGHGETPAPRRVVAPNDDDRGLGSRPCRDQHARGPLDVGHGDGGDP